MNPVLLSKIAAKYPKLLGCGDLLNNKLNQLSAADISRVASAVGVEIPVGPELQQAAISLLRGKDINQVADLIQHPDSFEEIFMFLRKGTSGLQELHKMRTLESIHEISESAPALAFLA